MKNCDRVVMFTLDDEVILVIVVAFRQGATLDSRADRQQEQSRLLLHHPRAIPFIVRLFVWSDDLSFDFFCPPHQYEVQYTQDSYDPISTALSKYGIGVAFPPRRCLAETMTTREPDPYTYSMHTMKACRVM